VFPTNLFASMLNFKEDKEFFEVDESQMADLQKPVEANF